MLDKAKITLVDGIKQVEAKYGPAIEAKFELDDSGALSLSVYPAAKGLKYDAEFNTFEEASGPAASSPWKPSIEVFKDAEHRLARLDLTLMQQTANLAAVRRAPRSNRESRTGRSLPAGRKPVIGVHSFQRCGATTWSFRRPTADLTPEPRRSNGLRARSANVTHRRSSRVRRRSTFGRQSLPG
jgi:hypothetical protein